MKRLLLLGVLLTSYLNAGMYGGVEWQKASLTGTYKETYVGTPPEFFNDVNKEWETETDLSMFGLNLGYGYADSFAGEVYLVTDGDAVKSGANLKYGFDIFDNNFLPHISVGSGILITGNTGYAGEYSTLFFQLGVGLSYVLNDTVEFYGDILLIMGLSDGSEEYDENRYYKDSSISYPVVVKHKWDTTSIGFQLGVKFHTFGSSTIRGDEALKLEEERQKNIDAFMD